MDYRSLPPYPGGADDASPDPWPLRDRHSLGYAVRMLLVVAAVGVVVFVALMVMLLLGGVPAYPGLA